jgi:hypothetical protein
MNVEKRLGLSSSTQQQHKFYGILLAPARNIAMQHRVQIGASGNAVKFFESRPNHSSSAEYENTNFENEIDYSVYDLLALPITARLCDIPLQDGDTIIWRERIKSVKNLRENAQLLLQSKNSSRQQQQQQQQIQGRGKTNRNINSVVDNNDDSNFMIKAIERRNAREADDLRHLRDRRSVVVYENADSILHHDPLLEHRDGLLRRDQQRRQDQVELIRLRNQKMFGFDMENNTLMNSSTFSSPSSSSLIRRPLAITNDNNNNNNNNVNQSRFKQDQRNESFHNVPTKWSAQGVALKSDNDPWKQNDFSTSLIPGSRTSPSVSSRKPQQQQQAASLMLNDDDENYSYRSYYGENAHVKRLGEAERQMMEASREKIITTTNGSKMKVY